VKGKTHSRFLSSERAAVVRQQIEAGQQFRATVDALWDASEALADSQLGGSSTASDGEAEKRASDEPSKRDRPGNRSALRPPVHRQPNANFDFEAVEMAARRQALRLAACALEQRINADTSDHVGQELPCPCGSCAQDRSRHEKTFESALGPFEPECRSRP
jgi:hypothetical protein